MNSKKTMLALIAFCVFLLLMVLICGIFMFGDSADAPSTSNTGADRTQATVPSDTTPKKPNITTAPQNTSSTPDTTLSPTTTVPTPETTVPSPETTVPTPETTVPTPETTVPTTQAPGQYPEAKGSFSSSSDFKLTVDVDWRTISRTKTEAEIEFTVVLNSDKIGVGTRNNNYIKIGDKSYRFSSPKVSVTESGKAETVLGVITAKVPLTDGVGTFDASCAWNFKGTYSGVKMDNIISEGVIEIK